MLTAISPIDGRYASKTTELSNYFSEFALIKYRILVEIKYFKALAALPLPQLEGIGSEKLAQLDNIVRYLSSESGAEVKEIEKRTNHDVKAVEYYIKKEFDELGLGKYKEFIHFGLTSQDVNNTATPLSLKDAIHNTYLPSFQSIIEELKKLSKDWANIPMLARTHGQPASPTRLGKEIEVFANRLEVQLEQLKLIPFSAKFGGATGGFNAHYVAYPEIDWHEFAKNFVENDLGLSRSFPTTQIEHYDNLGAIFHCLSRINTILIDFCRDIWTYISIEYFRQKTIKGEIGSSAMPHKVNPIDFENAEGNLGLANAIFGHLAEKLPISRLQRDLTDSTVLRNIGVPMGHTIIAFASIKKGLSKLLLNEEKLNSDLESNWMVVAEAIQNILRREGYPKPYEALLDLTRGKASITQSDMHEFINNLKVRDSIKAELKKITPQNYVGK
ncbi:MAG: adenylosuccinate lyase [Bacteroidetes bacterium]|jgi:adenylosuccinate lyase|nr:adenylosuccinate lyase [Bacteroidota bacterium]MDF1867061.1 adenylosuccinate lyase [Saprospiraceae bacterium]